MSKTINMKPFRAVAIDDVEDILELLAYNFNKEGIRIDVFSDSAEALADIFSNPPDVVISDWMMPFPDGIQVCKAIRTNDLTKHVPILMLTCKGSLSDYREAIDAGAQDCVAKPVPMEELIRRVKLLLPHQRGRANFG